jgi:CheY-like chemotaxis protein
VQSQASSAAPALLIVDDDEVLRLVAASLVSSLGFAAVQAADGIEALKAARRGAPLSAALVDLQKPRMDGYDAAVRLREGQRSGAFAPFPIIAVTSEGPDVERRCREAGVALVLCKPLTRSALAAALSELHVDAPVQDTESLKKIAMTVDSIVGDMRAAIHAAPLADAAACPALPLERAMRLAERLRAAAQAQALSPASVKMLPWLCSLARTLRLVLDRRLSIDVNVEPDCLNARVDAAALEKALIELCVNARDAMPGGGRLVLCARNTELPGRIPAVAVEVSDDGGGMDDPALQPLAEPFYNSRTGRPAGLGLPAVRGFARQAGGELHVRSRIGAGTTATLVLPAA